MAGNLTSPSSLPNFQDSNTSTGSKVYSIILIIAVAILLAILFISVLLSMLVSIFVIRSRISGRRITFQSFGIFRNSALDKRILQSMPVFVYGEGDEALECPVCLSEFEAGEKGRLVPNCGHRYHVSCIDVWFESHSTCPICRSDVGLNASGIGEAPRTEDVVLVINSIDASGASTSAGVGTHGP